MKFILKIIGFGLCGLLIISVKLLNVDLLCISAFLLMIDVVIYLIHIEQQG